MKRDFPHTRTRDWADVSLDRHLDDLEASEAFDNEVDREQAIIEADFRAKLAAGDEGACGLLAEEFSGLQGNEIDKLLGDAATGGTKLKQWASSFIYTHALSLAISKCSTKH